MDQDRRGGPLRGGDAASVLVLDDRDLESFAREHLSYDPNYWCREHGDPRYIVDLVKRVARVSVETIAVVRSLPELPI